MNNLKQDIDYYFNEQGLLVMTEHYLKNRGYCCKNGCLHCPYGFKKINSPELRPKEEDPSETES